MAPDRTLLSIWFGAIRRPGARVLVSEVIAEVAEKHGFTVADMISREKKAPLVRARQEAMWEARNRTNASLPMIGRAFLRDHSTIMHGIRQHEVRMVA